MASYAAAVRSRLVPPAEAAIPGRTARIEQKLALGVPQRIRLDDALELALVVPTGLAVEWRDRDPAAVASDSAAERAPHVEDAEQAVGALRRPPACLLLLDAGTVIGVVPLVAGARRIIPATGSAEHGARVDIAVVDWDLRAGAVRGPGDAVSRLAIHWRRADRAVGRFSTPPVPRRVVRRLEAVYRMESVLGLDVEVLAPWSKAKAKAKP